MQFRTAFAFFLASLTLPGAEPDLRLLDAARNNDLRATRALIAQHVTPNSADAEGSTPLHYAVRLRNLAMVEQLIAAGANASAANRYHITPLSLACGNGDAPMIQVLLKAGVDPNSISEEGQTALMSASLSGDVNAVRLLLAHGAKVNVAEPVRGQTALMWAASEGNTGAVELLIEFGADAKAKSKSGFTPLLFAVRNGHKEALLVLLAHGANANDVAPDGTSALNVAVVNACFEVAAVLLDHGADPNARDARGSALHTLAWLRKPGSDGGNGLGKRSYAPPLQTGNMSALELAKVLLEHGANPNARITLRERPFAREGVTRNPPLIHLGRHLLTFSGATPFYLAARNGDAPYMRLLADHGADPKLTNVLGITPLMVAAGLDYWEGESAGPYTGVSEAERLEAVKLAVELGNDINAAAHFGDYKMDGDPEYMLLYYPLNLAELADKVPGDPRWNGSTPLHAAVVSGQASIVQYLVDHGATLDAKTASGWTPLMLAGGVFFANAKKEFPAAAEILKKALAEHGRVASVSSSTSH
ncbi:MAG TPA: ankyrin repeat domain-containing protein [Bryobacteraceae bacterium]